MDKFTSILKNKCLDKGIYFLFIIYALVSPISLSATNISLGLIYLFGLFFIFNKNNGIKVLFQRNIINLFLLLFLWSALTRVITGNFIFREGFEDMWEYTPIIFIPLLLQLARINKEKVVLALLLFSSIVCLLGIIQFFIPSVIYPFPRQLVRIGDQWEFDGFFSHHLHTAGFYSVITILSFALILFWRCENKLKTYLLAFFILNFAALFLTMARSYFISAMAILPLVLLIKSWRWFVMGSVGFILLLVFILFFQNQVSNRFKSIIEPVKRNERIYVWKAAIEMIKEHPITGIGKGNWGTEAKERYYPRFNKEWSYSPGAYAHAHNSYLTQAAETGIIGFFLFSAFWGAIIWLLFSNLSRVPKDTFDYALIIGSLGGLANLFVAGLFENNFGTSVIMLLISMLIAISMNPRE